jgi:hypothetical protein
MSYGEDLIRDQRISRHIAARSERLLTMPFSTGS